MQDLNANTNSPQQFFLLESDTDILTLDAMVEERAARKAAIAEGRSPQAAAIGAALDRQKAIRGLYVPGFPGMDARIYAGLEED
jgi:hypothetical protein